MSADRGNLLRRSHNLALQSVRPDQRTQQPGIRNDHCWCGSGLKYKRCHEKNDRLTAPQPQEAPTLRKMSEILLELAYRHVDGFERLSEKRLQGLMMLIGIAWTISRFPVGDPDAPSIRKELAKLPEIDMDEIEVLTEIMERVERDARTRYPLDPRVVAKVDVVFDGRDLHVTVATARPGE